MSLDHSIRISEDEREELLRGESVEFPKYTGQILNVANQNASATQTTVVGEMSEIFDQFRQENPDGTYEDWVEFYYSKHNGRERIEEATDRIVPMVENFKEVIKEIDEEMTREWVEDLVLFKTFTGFGMEEAIAEKLAEELDCGYQVTGNELENSDVDIIVDNTPLSVKPMSYYESERGDIDVPTVYYEGYKTTDSVKIYIDELKMEGMF